MSRGKQLDRTGQTPHGLSAEAIALSCALLVGCRSHSVGIKAKTGEQGTGQGTSLHWFVATDGNDAWSGLIPSPNNVGTDGPLATLGEARQRLREVRRNIGRALGAIVEVRGGRYDLSAPLELTIEDSGTAEAPVVYQAYGRERVTVSGGKALDHFETVTDPGILSRLDVLARAHVRQVDLRAAGVTDFGAVATAGQSPELLFRGLPMTLARWPNDGFATIEQVVGGKPLTVHGVQGDAIGKFRFEGDRPSRWVNEADAWLRGYWFWDWADSYQKIQSIDPDHRVIELAPPYDAYGYRNGQRYYALNVLAELDSPGEWYLDRARGYVYFWPPDGINAGDVALSVLPTLISIKNASWITIQGLGFEATRSTIVKIEGGSHDRIAGCTLRGTSGWAVSIDGGTNNSVIACDISQTGEGGISLIGGDRRSLSPSGDYVDNNHIWSFGRLRSAYRPAIALSGVAIHVSHNVIHDGPHDAIQLSGNDHVIEWNEIYDVAQETDDVGALYTGRDWTARGTVIQDNYFHDLRSTVAKSVTAIYLDDAASGMTVSKNLFYRAGLAVLIGGGRDNTVENNIFVNCDPSVHVDARGLSWMRSEVEGDGDLPRLLREMPYTTPQWVARYPRLSTLLQEQPGAPQGNVVQRNISIDGPWLSIEKAAEPFVLLDHNLVDQDPKFVDAAALNFQLRKDSPAFALGFERIALDRIGLHTDQWRIGSQHTGK